MSNKMTVEPTSGRSIPFTLDCSNEVESHPLSQQFDGRQTLSECSNWFFSNSDARNVLAVRKMDSTRSFRHWGIIRSSHNPSQLRRRRGPFPSRVCHSLEYLSSIEHWNAAMFHKNTSVKFTEPQKYFHWVSGKILRGKTLKNVMQLQKVAELEQIRWIWDLIGILGVILRLRCRDGRSLMDFREIDRMLPEVGLTSIFF